MYEEVIIACPECEAQFIIPREYCGGVVDCSECGTTFEIEALPEDVEANFKKARSQQNKSKKTEDTNTVAISRNNLGMIPNLDDVRIG